MKKRIAISCCVLLAFSFCFSVVAKKSDRKSTLATANNDTYALGDIISNIIADDETEDKVSSVMDKVTIDGDVSNKIGGVVDGIIDGISGFDISGIADGFGGIVEKISDAAGSISGGGIGSGIIGGIFDRGSGTQAETYNIQTLAPMVTAAPTTASANYNYSPQPDAGQQPVYDTVAEESTTHGLTIDASASEVPYDKPEDTINPGDEGDGVRWIQWVFIYSDYGLRPDGITGIMDEDTVNLVKKLQQENGMKVDGIVTPEVIDKIELLYLQKSLGEDNTGQYIQPSAAVDEQTDTTVQPEDSDSKLIKILVVIAVIWTIALISIAVVFVMKKKKTAKAIKELDEGKKTENAEKSGGDKPEKGEIGGMSDLFDEANSGKKKRKK